MQCRHAMTWWPFREIPETGVARIGCGSPTCFLWVAWCLFFSPSRSPGFLPLPLALALTNFSPARQVLCRHGGCDPCLEPLEMLRLTDVGQGLACHLHVIPSLLKGAIRAPSLPCQPHSHLYGCSPEAERGEERLRVPITLAMPGPAGKHLLSDQGCLPDSRSK